MSNNQWQGGQQPPHQPPVPQAPPGAMPQQGHPQQGNPQQGHPQQPQQPQHGFQQPQHQQVGYPQGQPQGGYQQPGPGQAYAQQGYPQQMPVKKKSKAPAIIAGVLALALLAGGGFLAWYFLKGSPTAGVASQGLPADVLGVVEINLNPPAGDKLAVKELAEKFPAAKDKVSEVDGDYKKALWNLIPDSEDKPDYEELKPWLGDSVAVGFLPAEGSNPRVIGSVQITDKAKAEEFAKKHLDNVKVQFTDSLMVVTDDNDSFDVASVKDNSLAQNETYKKDLGKLSGSYLVTGWMSEAGSTFVTEQSGAKSEPAHGAMGMKVEDKAAVLHTVGASSGEPVEMSKGAREFLAGMPDLGYGGLSLAFNDQTHQMLWDALKPLTENQGMSLEELGITSVDDLKALLGTRLATTLDFPADGSEPRIAVKVETPDPAKHQELLKKLSDGAVPIEQKVDGNVVLSTVGISPDEASNPSAKLGDLEGFKQNTKGEGDSVIFFVDAPKILATFGQELPPEVASNLEPISGLGISGGDAGDGYSEFNVRVGTK